MVFAVPDWRMMRFISEECAERVWKCVEMEPALSPASVMLFYSVSIAWGRRAEKVPGRHRSCGCAGGPIRLRVSGQIVQSLSSPPRCVQTPEH